MPEYRNTSLHVQPLASGRVLAPGESSPVSDEPHDRALIAEGTLTPVETETDYAAMKHDQLEGLADAAGLDVKGTGKDGNVTNPDLVKALQANNKKES